MWRRGESNPLSARVDGPATIPYTPIREGIQDRSCGSHHKTCFALPALYATTLRLNNYNLSVKFEITNFKLNRTALADFRPLKGSNELAGIRVPGYN